MCSLQYLNTMTLVGTVGVVRLHVEWSLILFLVWLNRTLLPDFLIDLLVATRYIWTFCEKRQNNAINVTKSCHVISRCVSFHVISLFKLIFCQFAVSCICKLISFLLCQDVYEKKRLWCTYFWQRKTYIIRSL